MALTKTIAEIKEALPQFVSNLSDEAAMPNMAQAEGKYVIPLVDFALYNDIHTKYNANPQTLTEDDTVLLKKMRLVAVAYAYKDGLALGHITLTDNGARKFSPNNTQPVTKWEYEKLEATLLNTAADATDVLLSYLFEKKPALWTDSDVYKKTAALLIRTGTDFNEHYTLFQPARTFFSIRSAVEEVQELHLHEALGEDLVKHLVELATVPEGLTTVMKQLKKALALLSVAQCCKRFSVRFSDAGFTVLQADREQNNPDAGRMAANAQLLQLHRESCEETGQDYLAKAQYALYHYYNGSEADAAFKTALDTGPLKEYVLPADRESGNNRRKGVFRMP